MDNSFTITIDGPAGVGKTSLAKALADKLAIYYLDTGAMYRSVAFYLGKEACRYSEDSLIAHLNKLKFSFTGQGRASKLTINNKTLADEIRSEEIGFLASTLAKKKTIRDYLRTIQQAVGEKRSLVAEGRDMGTIVFPKARWKFFLTASLETRTERRCRQLQARGLDVSYEAIKKQLALRDKQDCNRSIAPLKPADDALVINSSNLSLKECLQTILNAIDNTDQSGW